MIPGDGSAKLYLDGLEVGTVLAVNFAHLPPITIPAAAPLTTSGSARLRVGRMHWDLDALHEAMGSTPLVVELPWHQARPSWLMHYLAHLALRV